MIKLTLFLWTLAMLMAGALIDDVITQPTKVQVEKVRYINHTQYIDRAVYQKVKHDERFNAQAERLAAAVPASALVYRRR